MGTPLPGQCIEKLPLGAAAEQPRARGPFLQELVEHRTARPPALAERLGHGDEVLALHLPGGLGMVKYPADGIFGNTGGEIRDGPGGGGGPDPVDNREVLGGCAGGPVEREPDFDLGPPLLGKGDLKSPGRIGPAIQAGGRAVGGRRVPASRQYGGRDVLFPAGVLARYPVRPGVNPLPHLSLEPDLDVLRRQPEIQNLAPADNTVLLSG